MQEGRSYSIKNFDKKGKHDSTGHYTISNVEQTGEGHQADVSIKLTDHKGKELMQMQQGVRCDENNVYFDVSSFLSGVEAMSEMEFSVSDDLLAFPKTVSVGDKLNDGRVDVSMGGESAMGLGMSFNITDREVEAKESITTPAGTFDTYKIAYNYAFNMGIITIRGKNVEWWSDDYLVVKAEYYNKKGKLTGSNLLDSVN